MNKIVCEKCEHSFSHYNNVYGTRCPKCNFFIKSLVKPDFIIKSDLKNGKIKDDALHMIKDKVFKKEV